MSARSLGELAVKRNDNPPGTDVSSATATLVATIPTETLAAYTAIVGATLAAGIGTQYGPFRWATFVAFVVLAFLAPMVAYRRPQPTHEAPATIRTGIPILECSAAAFAAAAWGLVMPGSPLSIVLDGNALTFSTVSIIVGATAVLAFATKFLGKANKNVPAEPPPTVETPSEQPGAVPGLVPIPMVSNGPRVVAEAGSHG